MSTDFSDAVGKGIGTNRRLWSAGETCLLFYAPLWPAFRSPDRCGLEKVICRYGRSSNIFCSISSMPSAYQTPVSTAFIAWQLDSLVVLPLIGTGNGERTLSCIPKTATIQRLQHCHFSVFFVPIVVTSPVLSVC